MGLALKDAHFLRRLIVFALYQTLKIRQVVGNARIEPATSSMSTKRSTTELIARIGQGGNRTPEG